MTVSELKDQDDSEEENDRPLLRISKCGTNAQQKSTTVGGRALGGIASVEHNENTAVSHSPNHSPDHSPDHLRALVTQTQLFSSPISYSKSDSKSEHRWLRDRER